MAKNELKTLYQGSFAIFLSSVEPPPSKEVMRGLHLQEEVCIYLLNSGRNLFRSLRLPHYWEKWKSPTKCRGSRKFPKSLWNHTKSVQIYRKPTCRCFSKSVPNSVNPGEVSNLIFHNVCLSHIVRYLISCRQTRAVAFSSLYPLLSLWVIIH